MTDGVRQIWGKIINDGKMMEKGRYGKNIVKYTDGEREKKVGDVVRIDDVCR